MRKGKLLDPRAPQINLQIPESGTGNHPIAVAAVAVASTVGFMLLLFNEVILPVRTADLEKELGNVTREAIELRGEVSSKTSQVESLNKQLRSIRDQLYELQTESLFGKNNPFPQGLQDIRPGSSRKELENTFSPETIEKTDKGYWTVNLEHSIFKSTIYYFDNSKDDQAISHIMYRLGFNHKFGNEFLQNKLEDALGAPRQWEVKGYYSWETKRRAVYKSDPDSFVVMNKGRILALWPSN